jgi:hypothetical protein
MSGFALERDFFRSLVHTLDSTQCCGMLQSTNGEYEVEESPSYFSSISLNTHFNFAQYILLTDGTNTVRDPKQFANGLNTTRKV